MLRVILVLLYFLCALSAHAQQTQTQIKNGLVGRSMAPELATYVARLLADGATVVDNNSYLLIRNAAGTANISVLKVDANDDTVLNADTGDVINLAIAGTAEFIVKDNELETSGNQVFIASDTADASDTKSVGLAGGGAGGSSTRGAQVLAFGNEATSTGGYVVLDSGAVAASQVLIRSFSATGSIVLGAGANGESRWSVSGASGDLTANGTNGGSLVFGVEGKGITEKQGTLAAAGSAQGDAGAIVARVTTVTASDSAKGVRLPATPTAGDKYAIINTVSGQTLKVYPGTGDAINGLAANAAMTMAALTVAYCDATSASQWWCSEGVVPD